MKGINQLEMPDKQGINAGIYTLRRTELVFEHTVTHLSGQIVHPDWCRFRRGWIAEAGLYML